MKFPKLWTKRKIVPTPKGYHLVYQTLGDLDNDGQDECVSIYNSSERDAFGHKRELQIHKLNDDKWELWIKSDQILPPSEYLGLQDNEVQVYIDQGILSLRNIAKSKWSLDFTDKYQLQSGVFKFISHQSVYGKEGNYWININLDVTSGQLNFRKDYDGKSRDSEIEEMTLDLPNLTIENRQSAKISFITPKYGIEWEI